MDDAHRQAGVCAIPRRQTGCSWSLWCTLWLWAWGEGVKAAPDEGAGRGWVWMH